VGITIPPSVTGIGDGAFNECDSLVAITVERGSYAQAYCEEQGLPYTYSDNLDGLND
jgi:hypothetical protein